MTGIIDPGRFGVPDATTTGVPTGTTLTAYMGPMIITTPGTVIEGKIIDGTLKVEAANVTIKNCVVKNYGWWGIDAERAANITVQNCDFTASSSQDTNAAILGSGNFIGNDISNSTNGIVLTGGASVVRDNYIHDLRSISSDPHVDGISVQGGQQVGTATANSSGAWSTTTSALSAGSHVLTAKATDIAGNVSAASAAVDPVIGGSSGTPGSGTPGSGSGATLPAAPKIALFSRDSGVAGDHITSDNTVTLTGSATAKSTVKVYDGTTPIGSVTADANGAWTYTTSALPDGKHSFTATDTVSGATSAKSAPLALTVDTAAPDAPLLLSDSTIHHRATVTGAAEAGSAIKLYEGTTLLGTATAGTDGHFSVTTSGLKGGSHTFTATAADSAGNTSALSQPLDPNVGSHGGNGNSTVEITNAHQNWNHTATIKGTADPHSQIKLYDGTKAVGSVTAGADGKWNFTTSDLSNKSHTYTAKEVDSTGHVVGTSSGGAIFGTHGSNTLTGTTGNDVFVGKYGADTFVFASNFGQDVIKDFAAKGASQDTIQLSKSVFDSFASVLAHATQSGHDVVISTGGDTLTLKNTKLDALNSHDFHFAL